MAPPLSLQLGRFLKERRTALGLSTYQVAKLADVPQSTIVRFELGQYAAPRPEKLSRIAGALQLPVGEVFAQMGYVNAHDLPEIETYLFTKYNASKDVIDHIATMARAALHAAEADA